MQIVVSETGVSLANPSEFTRFEVVSHVERAQAADLLSKAGAGALREDDHVEVPEQFLRTAAGEVAETEEWNSGFGKMLGYAQSKGWVTDGGDILAHVEWEGAAGA